jgi:uncharacterized protein YcgI (DUF1989 family)
MTTQPAGQDPVPGTVVRVVEIPARHGGALEVARGQVLRVIDVEGQQVGDLVCFNRADLVERYSPQNTVLFNRTIYPKVGAALVSDRGRVMMRLVADTNGVHDLICGSCSDEYYKNRLDHHAPHRSCRGNLAEAMAPWGVAAREIPFSFNLFMRWPVQPDGSVLPMAPTSAAGDYVDLLAEMDLIVANSACPSDITPTNGHKPTAMRFVLYQPAAR